jgi:sugar phosphate isomerase/epimerase
MITLSAFADEAASDLATQMDVLESVRVKAIDVRNIDGRNVSTFTNEQATAYRRQMDDRGFRTACIGSPIGKIRLDEPMGPHMESLARCIEIAHIMGTPYVRMFSFFAPQGGDFAGARPEVFNRLSMMLAAAKAGGVILLHENEYDVYGRTTAECLDILKTFGGEHFKGIFDPANFVLGDVKPYDDAWTKGLAELTFWFHIKDAVKGEGHCCPAGKGQGQFDKLLPDLKRRRWSGTMTIEPHMAAAGTYGGYSGADLFRVATTELQRLLDENELDWV